MLSQIKRFRIICKATIFCTVFVLLNGLISFMITADRNVVFAREVDVLQHLSNLPSRSFTGEEVGTSSGNISALVSYLKNRSASPNIIEDTTWYVTTSGNNANDCQSWGTACRTIQAAIDKAAIGDSINVGAGTYPEYLNITKDLILVGSGADGTIIDAGGSSVGYVICIDFANVMIRGFTITGTGGSQTSCGWAFGEGSAISHWGTTTLTLENSRVRDNHRAISAGTNLYLYNNFIENNSSWGVYAFGSAQVIAYNNTFVDNNIGIAIYGDEANLVAKNNIFDGNASIGIMFTFPTVSHTVSYNLNNDGYQNVTQDGTNTVGNPDFVDRGSSNFHLGPASVAINAGTLDGNTPSHDYDGEVRPQQGGVDIGADESPHPPPPSEWYVTTSGNDANDCQSWGSACQTIQAAIYKASNGDTIYVGEGDYLGNLSLKPNIALLGAGAHITTIAGHDLGGDQRGVIRGAEGALVAGFTIANDGVTSSYGYFPEAGADYQMTFQNNVFTGHYVGIHAGSGSPHIIHSNVFINNTASGITYGWENSPEIINNIIVGNGDGIHWFGTGSPQAYIDYNDVWNNAINYDPPVTPGANDISADPLFVDGASGDYRLHSCSPAIDVGDPSFDYSNEPAPNGDRVNMGAFGNTPEATSYFCPIPGNFGKTSPANGADQQPTSLTLSWESSNDAANYEYCYDTTGDDNCTNWIDNGVSTSVDLSGLTLDTTYYWQVRANSLGGTTYADNNEWWLFTTTSSAQCQSVTEIPVSECVALAALYESTNGPFWTNNDGWVTNNTPCLWNGVTCQGGHVTYLDLYNNNLVGNIPPELGYLTQLERLYLNVNSLTGNMPTSLGNLTSLTALWLNENQLVGTLPIELENLGLLEDLVLSGNQLTGGLPPQWQTMTNLTLMDVSSNQLSGSIPASYGNLTNLQNLYLSHNQLTGPLPSQLCAQGGLRALRINYNQISEGIPQEIGDCTNMQELLMNSNRLVGAIPSSIENLTNLVDLDLGRNALEGEIPSNITSLNGLTYASIGYNRLFASDPDVITYLEDKFPGWANSQTISPNDLQVTDVYSTNLQLMWNPITYTWDGGYYEISYAADPSGPFSLHGGTVNKFASSYIVDGLLPDTTYYFRMRTFTPAHPADGQQNDLWSGYTSVITTTTTPIGNSSTQIEVQPGIGSTLVYTDTIGNHTTVQIPAQVFTETTTLLFTDIPTSSAPSGYHFAGHAFDLSAFREGIRLHEIDLQEPVTITLEYSSDEILGMDEASLALWVWNEDTLEWVDAATTCSPPFPYERHPEENWLRMPVCHLSQFALFSEIEESTMFIYLPLAIQQ